MGILREKIEMKFPERIFGVACLSAAAGLLFYWTTYIFFLLLRATRLNNPEVLWFSSGIIGSACCALIYLGYSELAYSRELTPSREEVISPGEFRPQRTLILRRNKYGRVVSIDYLETARISESQPNSRARNKIVSRINRASKAKSMLSASILLLLILGTYSTITVLGYTHPDLVSGTSLFVVIASESMSPNLRKGDFTILRKIPSESIQKGDVVAFKVPSPYDKVYLSPTVHRVIEKRTEKGVTYFRTKGDANLNPDPWTLPAENLIGKCITVIPYLGLPILFMKTPLGFTLLTSTIIGYLLYTLHKNRVKDYG